MWIEYVIAGVVVVLAAAFAVCAIIKTLKGQGSGMFCDICKKGGGQGCGAGTEAECDCSCQEKND